MGDKVIELKQEKSKAKTVFTKTRNKLLKAVEEELIDKNIVNELSAKFDNALDEVIFNLDQLCTLYKELAEFDHAHRTNDEVEQINQEYSEATQTVYSALQKQKSTTSLSANPESHIEKDLWRQMKRVGIPIFDGNKKKYESWKAAFSACIDSTPVTAEYKLLQLRQYLKGEALQVIEELGHSQEAYIAAKERLERKYGGERRKLMRYLNEIESFPSLKYEDAKSVEKMADLLDVTVINLKETNHDEELGQGALYLTLQKKLPEKMLIRYHRFISENEEEEGVETLRDWINKESQFLQIAQETKNGLASKLQQPKSHQAYFVKDAQPKYVKSCEFCNKQNHTIWECRHYKELDIETRWEKAKQLRLCFRCLRKNHAGKNCRKFSKCNVNGCTKLHHYLLHKDGHTRNQSGLDANVPNIQQLNHNVQAFVPHEQQQQPHENYHNTGNRIALRTVPVVVSGANGRKMTVNAILDDGSTKTYVNSSLAAALGLQGSTEKVKVNLLNGKTETFETMTVHLNVKGINSSDETTNIEAFVIDNVTGSLKTIDWQKHSYEFDHLRNIHFPAIGKNNKVDLLIGLDYANLHSCLREVCGAPGQPIARLTPLGWTCVGKVNSDADETYMNFFVTESNDAELNVMIRNFWEIDSYGVNKEKMPLSQSEETLLRSSEEAMTYNDGRYTVKTLWNQENVHLTLPNNYEMAHKRLLSTEKRLEKEEKQVKMLYRNTISSYLDKGYLQEVSKEEKVENKWFLPHFPVIRMHKETTKVRIVFDASAKFQGISLNDCIETGPKLQNDLFDVLLRFRKHKIAIACDISEMYLQVGIVESDRKYHRILWDGSEYEFTRLVFGVNASPFLAQMVSQTNARRFAHEYPAAAATVIESTYMDDSMDSVGSEEEGLELYHQLSQLWLKAGMYARKWISNSVTVLENIPAKDRAAEINLETGYLPKTKALGVSWIADTDMFSFSAKKEDTLHKVTKRNLLKAVASLFDPLGFISPYVVIGKILMQKLWLCNYDWDDKVDQDLEKETIDWVSNTQYLNNIAVPRCLCFSETEQTVLHTFVDASEEAYSAVTYVRHENQNDERITVRFVCSKTRVAPLVATSIPRLELMAAVLGVRLAKTVGLTLQVTSSNMMFWSDSENVLHWITGQSRHYKPFVANRIGEIHENSIPCNWHHVPGDQNPADIGSRGLSADKLVNCSLWWQGPEFLHEQPDLWPKGFKEKQQCDDTEKKQKYQAKSTDSYLIQDENQINDRLEPKHFSSWTRMLRVFAWVNRFITNCRTKKQSESDVLTYDELNRAENRYILYAQKEAFPNEYSALLSEKPVPSRSKVVSLNAVLDENGLIRSNTRLQFSKELPFNTVCPVVLPRRHPVTKLIVKHFHEQNGHCGTNQTLAALSTRYWLISGREEIREVENDCRKCRLLKSRTSQQIMAPLPKQRTEKTLRAFAYTSVDYGGPFLTKQGRGKSRQKRYLCLFTCLSSRAVHLEMATNLDTDSFLNAFCRFKSRRGVPKEMFSDNGTNFVGARRELKELYGQIDKDKVKAKTADQSMKWHFNPPSAPHFGGIHEIMIKSAKRAVYRILSGADVTDEELQTAFIIAEGLINSRPLSYQSSNPSDNTVLTPNHFLHGQLGGEFAPEAADDIVYDHKKRWHRVQEIVNHFWKRWLKEIIPAIGSRKKWFQEKDNLSVGDVVLIVDPDQPRGRWRLGRVSDTYPGVDGRVRVASVRVGESIYKRPITRLCLIEKCA